MPTNSKQDSKTFSVLTVSKRTGWEVDARKTLEAQTTHPQWIVIHEGPDTIDRPRWTDVGVYSAPKRTRASNLNASLNAGLKHITSDYVIFYQDFIDLPEDCFERLQELVDDRTFVTTATINPDGTDDNRYLGADMARPCRPDEWEANVAIAPMKLIRELGGFDERLDDGWAWDNVNLAQRAAMLGARFLIDEGNRPQLLPHEQTSKLKLELNGQRCANIIDRMRSGEESPILNYL